MQKKKKGKKKNKKKAIDLNNLEEIIDNNPIKPNDKLRIPNHKATSDDYNLNVNHKNLSEWSMENSYKSNKSNKIPKRI